MTIDGCTITDDSDCYVIAEIGHNHQGDLEKVKELFRRAKECGVDAVKRQKCDNHSADFLAALDMPAYKIASGDLRNLPLLAKKASLHEDDSGSYCRQFYRTPN